MQISELIALFRRKMSEQPMSAFEEMREALKPQKERTLPPNVAVVPKVKKRG
jgi:hypothetical protein